MLINNRMVSIALVGATLAATAGAQLTVLSAHESFSLTSTSNGALQTVVEDTSGFPMAPADRYTRVDGPPGRGYASAGGIFRSVGIYEENGFGLSGSIATNASALHTPTDLGDTSDTASSVAFLEQSIKFMISQPSDVTLAFREDATVMKTGQYATGSFSFSLSLRRENSDLIYNFTGQTSRRDTFYNQQTFRLGPGTFELLSVKRADAVAVGKAFAHSDTLNGSAIVVAQAVPEPATLAILALGVCGFVRGRRKSDS